MHHRCQRRLLRVGVHRHTIASLAVLVVWLRRVCRQSLGPIASPFASSLCHLCMLRSCVPIATSSVSVLEPNLGPLLLCSFVRQFSSRARSILYIPQLTPRLPQALAFLEFNIRLCVIFRVRSLSFVIVQHPLPYKIVGVTT